MNTTIHSTTRRTAARLRKIADLLDEHADTFDTFTRHEMGNGENGLLISLGLQNLTIFFYGDSQCEQMAAVQEALGGEWTVSQSEDSHMLIRDGEPRVMLHSDRFRKVEFEGAAPQAASDDEPVF